MSTKVNVNDETFEHIMLFDKQHGLYTICRVDRETLPEGWYCYDLRHEDHGDFCTLENHVFVDHAGSVIVKDPIDIPDGGIIDIHEKLSFTVDGPLSFTFDEFSKFLTENKTNSDSVSENKEETK